MFKEMKPTRMMTGGRCNLVISLIILRLFIFSLQPPIV